MNNPNIEPLTLLIEKYGLDLKEVKKIFSGERYSGVLLNNGNIGLCSGTGKKIPINKEEYTHIDLSNYKHRVFLNAYFNAKFNYSNDVVAEPDIFKAVNFKKYKNVVMLGFIKPVAKELKKRGIKLVIFDMNRIEPELTPIEKREEFLGSADAVILSSTAIANGTFLQTIESSKEETEIFILGPSSLMIKEILEYPKVKFIFGSVFQKNDNRIIEIVERDGGTREFLKLGIKKAIGKS